MSLLATLGRRQAWRGAGFLLLVATGLVNGLSSSWSPFFRLNLLLHPLIGVLVAAAAIRISANQLRSYAAGLTPSLLLVTLATVFIAFFKAFVFQHLPIDQSNKISGVVMLALIGCGTFLFVRGRRVSGSAAKVPGIGGEFARFLLWGVVLASGLSIVLTGGGRSALVLSHFHLVVAMLVTVVGAHGLWRGARGRGRALARTLVLVSMLACGVPPLINAVGYRFQQRPAASTATVHLSTIPLERREPGERDAVSPIGAEWVDISASCGSSSDCHADLLADHRRSSHSTAYATPHLQKNLALLADEIGRKNQVLCNGCHTPAVFFKGGGRTEDYAHKDNMTCVFCHVISDIGLPKDPRKSSYTIDLPVDHVSMFLDAERAGGKLDAWNRRLIQLNLRAHGGAFRRDIQGEDRFCMGCHHLQLRGMAGDKTCVQCHMEPRQNVGRSGLAKNHLFTGSNTVVPSLLGFKEVAAITTRWMQGGFLETALGDAYGTQAFPQVKPDAQRLADFRYLSMSAELVQPASRGQPITLKVLTRNTGIGHGFPTSALDLEEVWLTVRVTDETGRVLLESGRLDASHRVEPGAHKMGGHMIGLDGQPVTHNRVWQIREKVIDRMILPGETGVDTYALNLPADAGRFLNVEAGWRYRKLNQPYWEWAYGSGTESPAPYVVQTLQQFPIGPAGP